MSHSGISGQETVALSRKANSPRARDRFNQGVEAKRFEGVFLCRKAC